MTLQDFVKTLRSRWMTVCATAIIIVVAAGSYTLTQTPMYQSATRLFVSTTSASSTSDLYNANLLSQERVLSYAQLIMGETLAQRTVDRLALDISAAELKARVTAKTRPDTVLIDVFVRDPSPVRARDIANALSDEFVVMVRELETPSQGERPEARVVVEQRASVPSEPISPKKFRNIALGILLGVLLGIGLAVVRDLLDNTIKKRETLEEVAGAGVVGLIPFDRELQERPAIAFDSDNSGTAEAFRKIRTNLQFLSVDKPPRVIVVTSTSPSEGKTTSAMNIALALSEAGHSVVVVDGDLRRPRLAKYLDVVASVGLSSALSGAASIGDVLQETKYPQLSVLAAGPIPPNPSELLGSQSARNLLHELSTKFDYVIIDSAPLLAVTDSAILAAEADGALLAVRWGKTRREQLTHAVGALRDVGAPLLGTMLTMMPRASASTYSYQYHYGDKRERSNSDASDRSTAESSTSEVRHPENTPALRPEN